MHMAPARNGIRFVHRLGISATTLCLTGFLIAQEAQLVRRRILLPDFMVEQTTASPPRAGNDFAQKLRVLIEENDRYTIIDQRLLVKLRPNLKNMPANAEEWAKLGEELNCENVIVGRITPAKQKAALQVSVLESVTRAEIIAHETEIPAGASSSKVTNETLSQLVRQINEKLEPLDAGEVWREVTLEARLVKLEDEYYRPKRAARAERLREEKIKADQLEKKRFDDERKRQLAKLELQRKQRLREIEQENKRVAALRAQNPNYDAASGLGGELARVVIFDFTDQTGSNDYQYLSGSLAGGVDVAMKARFNYMLVDPERAAKVKAENFKNGWLPDVDAESIARQSSADILISGSYSIPPGQKQLNIRTVIFINPTGEMMALPDFSNPIDSTLFEATDILSAQIVQKIMELARKQMGAKSIDPKAKVTLTRAITTGWPTKSWELAGISGFERVNGGGQLSTYTSFLSLRFFPGEKAAWRFGVFGGVSILPGPTTAVNAGGFPPAAGVEVGYQWFLSSRWKFFADLAPRYDFASPRSSGGFVPAARGGFSFLILSSLALEWYVDAAYYTFVSKLGYGTGIGITLPF